MTKTVIKTLACSFGALLITAPLAFAAGSSTTSQSGQSTQQRMNQSGSSQTSGGMGMMSETTSATVASVNKSQGTVTIRPENSQQTVELKVPQQMLNDLQAGDSLEVSIRKASGSSSGMPHSPSSSPGMSGSGTQSPSGTGSSGTGSSGTGSSGTGSSGSTTRP